MNLEGDNRGGYDDGLDELSELRDAAELGFEKKHDDDILLEAVSAVYWTHPQLALYQEHTDAVMALLDVINLDVSSSASRQHHIDTGRFLRKGEAS